jgi:tetratricopeptide (TPR) repeat protein
MEQGREAGMSDETNDSQQRAEQLHQAGMELSNAGNEDAAIEQYLAALAVDPDRPSTLYNLGLIYKYRSH